MSATLSRSIARATGESVATIRSRGFSILALEVPRVKVPESLCIACPGCGRDVPVDANDPHAEWAECETCDIAYPYDDDEVFLPDNLVAA